LLLRHRLESLQQKGLTVEVQQEYQDLPLVFCSARQINQVLIALLDNALDAICAKFLLDCPEPAEYQAKITLKLRVQSAENLAEVCIVDNGIGIDPAIQAQIFNPFFTAKPVGQGTGLGLAICDRIIADHSGTLTVQSLPGQHTEVIVQLPIAPAANF
jgi:signal transduction histidine kinase